MCHGLLSETPTVLGGLVLHDGDIAEMRTGEGKTLTSTMPVYLNALGGEGVHVVTVNPYLAARDREWMGRIYEFLGLEAGLVYSGQSRADKRVAYAADVTYGTNSEFGFDFLRDHMVLRPEDLMQRGHASAIVDEVASILVDEARTPLIISGPAEQATADYELFARQIMPRLRRDEHYEVDEAKRPGAITELVSDLERLALTKASPAVLRNVNRAFNASDRPEVRGEERPRRSRAL